MTLSSSNFADDKPAKSGGSFAVDTPSKSANSFAADLPAKNSDIFTGDDTTTGAYGGDFGTYGDIYGTGPYGGYSHFKNRTTPDITHT